MNTLKQLLKIMSSVDHVEYYNFEELIETQREIFNKFFMTAKPVDECIYLSFYNQIECDLFYTHSSYVFSSLNYSLMYVIDESRPFTLSLRPVIDIPYISDLLADFSYKYHLDFKVEFQQSFTNHFIAWDFVNGEIINPRARLEINVEFPYLSIGRLSQIFYDTKHFELFNPIINYHHFTTII